MSIRSNIKFICHSWNGKEKKYHICYLFEVVSVLVITKCSVQSKHVTSLFFLISLILCLKYEILKLSLDF